MYKPMNQVLRVASVLLTCLAGACGGPPPSPSPPGLPAGDASARVHAALEVTQQARSALAFIGLLPPYKCNTPPAPLAPHLEQLRVRLARARTSS